MLESLKIPKILPAAETPRKRRNIRPVLTSESEQDTDDESWNPKKRNRLQEDACDTYAEGTCLSDDEMVYLLNVFHLTPTDTSLAPNRDTLVLRMEAFYPGKRASTEWKSDIVNTDGASGRGVHWILALWRWHRGKLEVTLWEPYNHTKYSQRVATTIAEAFPGVAVPVLIPVGEQDSGDGWRCGYICVWWQILVQKLVSEDCAPSNWSRPLETPRLWVNLVWSVLRISNAQRPVYRGRKELFCTGTAPAAVRSLLLDEWLGVVTKCKLDEEALDQMQELLRVYQATLKVGPVRLV